MFLLVEVFRRLQHVVDPHGAVGVGEAGHVLLGLLGFDDRIHLLRITALQVHVLTVGEADLPGVDIGGADLAAASAQQAVEDLELEILHLDSLAGCTGASRRLGPCWLRIIDFSCLCTPA